MDPNDITQGAAVRVAKRSRRLTFSVATGNAVEVVVSGSGRDAVTRDVYIVEGPNGMRTAVEASEMEEAT